MCILFIFTDPDPQPGGYRVIIASNRDEFYRRPARGAFLCPNDKIIGGRDMEAGRENGMWLGVSIKRTEQHKFRFGALLNVTGEERKFGVLGRGFIVTDYLKDTQPAEEYIKRLQQSEQVYNAFNFVAIESNDESIKTYHNSNTPFECTEFEGKQILGFGNSTCKVPLQKVKAGRERFAEIVNKLNNKQNQDQLYSELLELLRWRKSHLPDEELVRRAPTLFEPLSSVYVKCFEGYGTRTHSIIFVDYDWNMDFVEDTMKEPIDSSDPIWENVKISSHL